MRIGVFDIEATKLKADQGFLLCGGFMDLATGKKTIHSLATTGIGRDRLTVDKYLVEAIRDEIAAYDGLVTWNGLMFDFPFVDDRLTLCNLSARPRIFARGLDLRWHVAIGKSTFTSARLDWAAKAMGCPFLKTPLVMNTWTKAEAEVIACLEPKVKIGRLKIGKAKWPLGHENFDEIIVHNEADLDVTAWMYERLKDRVQTISKR